MANWYVDSNATGGGTGADWANAYTTLQAAFTAKTAGDNFWVAHDHAESNGAALTLTPAGASATGAQSTVICVNKAGTVPPVAADLRTTAVIASGAGAYNLVIGNGRCYWYGITFKSGTGAVNSSINVTGAGWNRFEQCQFWKPGTTGVASAVRLSGGVGSTSDDRVELCDCTVKLGATSDTIGVGGGLVWKNPTTPNAIDASGSVPAYVFSWSTTPNCFIEGCDFSNGGSTGLTVTTVGMGIITLKNCKFRSPGTVPALPVAGRLDIINSNVGTPLYRHERYQNMGAQTVETTVVRTGGATDGTTPIAWKIVTTSAAKWIQPFEAMPLAIWNDTTGGDVTATVYGIWGGGAVPNNDDIWMEVSYMGASTSPLATINTTNGKASFLASNGAQGTDGVSSWGGSTTPFKMSVTLSSPQPAEVGYIYLTIKAAAASATFYVDPKPVLT